MIIGEEGAVSDLWSAARSVMPGPREDRPGQPVYAIEEPPAGRVERSARGDDRGSRPARARLRGDAPRGARGRPARARPGGLPAGERRAQIQEGRSWLWAEDGTILFKAEASAWTPSAVQLQQVWVDPEVRRQGHATRGLSDLCRLLLERTPSVCLFVRPENAPAIRLYEKIGMRRAGLPQRALLT